MTRVAIIGNAGGGKSVLARHLSTRLRLPVHVVDDVQWQPNWTPAPARVVAAAHASWLASDRWIIDGWGSWDLLARRFDAADTIVLIDFPLHVHLRWAMQRQIKASLGMRRDWPPPGSDAWPVTRRLLATMRRVHEEMRPRLLAMLAEPAIADRVVRIRSPRQLRAWRASVAP